MISPGPWRWTPGEMGELTRLRSSQGHTVIRTAATPSPDDAQAIASVPEMVELLLSLDGQLEEWQGDYTSGEDPFTTEDGTDLRAYWRERISKVLGQGQGKAQNLPTAQPDKEE